MAKVLITGFREWSMTDDNGKPFEGCTVYYKNVLQPGQDGRPCGGYASGKMPVKIGSEVHRKILGTDFLKPFEAEPIYELVPGNSRPVLTDIRF